ncbi:site-specific integrase [Oxalobacteraceae bacterium OTU3CINTB1]|nr:site-specific integrase [Oxalobacteraceae bacterium OTU3CINTB1]
MGFSVRYGDADKVRSAGFGRVAELPFIFDSRPGYHRVSSWYLMDRGTGDWSPTKKFESGLRPSAASIRDYADWLINFLEWAEARSVDLIKCEYNADLIEKYQAEMISGEWSRDGAPLAGATINSRVQEACYFLTWMADQKLRPEFKVPYRRNRAGSNNYKSSDVEIKQREGKVRVNKKRLRMPNDNEIAEFTLSVYEVVGEAEGLMSETILLTALRRAEISCWRTDTLPADPRDWEIVNPNAPISRQSVRVSIRYGTKGTTYGYNCGDKIGPERDVFLPLGHAYRLNHYYNNTRNKSLAKYISSADVKEQNNRIKKSVHLFINSDGERIHGKALYRAWKKGNLPYKNWSPHLGRDWWACSVLLKEMEAHKELLKLPHAIASVLLTASAMTIIQLNIMPRLGHSSPETSMIYLHWISDMMGFNIVIDYEIANQEAYEKRLAEERRRIEHTQDQ